MTYGCIRFIDSYRFPSSNLDSLVKTLVDNSHRTLKKFEEKIVDNEKILHFVNEIKRYKENKYKKHSIKDLKKNFPDKNKNFEEALLN